MGMFGGVRSGRNMDDEKGNQAAFRRMQNELQIMEEDLKKLGKERDLAHRTQTELRRELSRLSTDIRENQKIVSTKDREFFQIESELKRQKKKLLNLPK